MVLENTNNLNANLLLIYIDSFSIYILYAKICQNILWRFWKIYYWKCASAKSPAFYNSFTKPDQQKATPTPSLETQFSDIQGTVQHN